MCKLVAHIAIGRKLGGSPSEASGMRCSAALVELHPSWLMVSQRGKAALMELHHTLCLLAVEGIMSHERNMGETCMVHTVTKCSFRELQCQCNIAHRMLLVCGGPMRLWFNCITNGHRVAKKHCIATDAWQQVSGSQNSALTEFHFSSLCVDLWM